MKELIELLNSSGKTKFDFAPHGLKFQHEGFIGFIMRCYLLRETWMFNIADDHDNWNTSRLDPEATTKITKHLQRSLVNQNQ